MKMITVIRICYNPNKKLHPNDPISKAYDVYGTVIPESELNAAPIKPKAFDDDLFD